MGLFKKKKIPVEPVKKECSHKWKDFDWYIESTCEEQRGQYKYRIRIYEPYVCLLCKKRDNRLLEDVSGITYNKKDYYREGQKLYELYFPRIKNRAIVEDQIEDTLKDIDRMYLRIWDKIKNGQDLNIGENHNDEQVASTKEKL